MTITYYLSNNAKREEFQVFIGADRVYHSRRWREIVDFLKSQYRESGRVPLDIQTTNIYDTGLLVGLECLIEKMRRREIE